MKQVILLLFIFLAFGTLVNSKALPQFDNDFFKSDDDFPKGWDFKNCNNCKIIGNGRENTNTVYIKSDK
ncbi:unnamed protein product [Leptidea sinapis]|uniref:Uncharacterized protein n=1 Tax=Leptidea sinapis TaxID=189913 RepID=A0A5E4Q1D4_9NEOP|nr:unnamed protein product [Leptidea sinapis]